MSEISEEATNLIDNFEYAVEDAVSDYTMACGASQKHQARRNLEDYIAELEGKIDQLTAHDATERQDDKWIPLEEVQESEATACKFCGSDKSDRRMNSIVCSSCGRKIGNVAPPEVK